MEGVPKVKFGTADSFFKRLEKYIPQLPKWVGELYLELHRGTLTTQSRTKRNNRKCEELLAATEFIYCCLPADKYPAKELDKMWKTLLCNQFHDIIPGSSVRQVYTVTEEEHAEIIAKCEELIGNASALLSDEDENALTLVNTLGYDAEQVITLPDSWNGFVVTDSCENTLETQYENGKTLCLAKVPAAQSRIPLPIIIKDAVNAAEYPILTTANWLCWIEPSQRCCRISAVMPAGSSFPESVPAAVRSRGT